MHPNQNGPTSQNLDAERRRLRFLESLKMRPAKPVKRAPRLRRIRSLAERRTALARRQGAVTDMAEVSTMLEICACEICAKPTQKRSHTLDHDPGTGAMRGVLCTSCNLGLGLLGDTPEGLRRALAYVESPPAALRRRGGPAT